MINEQDTSNPPPYRRKEVIGNATLLLGDSTEILPHLHGDALITDPVWPNCPPGLIPGSDDPWGLFERFAKALPPRLRQIVICMRNDSDPRILKHIPDAWPFQQMGWCQYVMPGYLGRVLGGNECAYVFGAPVKKQKHRNVVPSISPKAQPSDRPPNGHPCSRALIHQKWLVNWFSDEGEVVIDPFMGSGTTGEACICLGRHFIGIEISEEFFEIALDRLRNIQPDMFSQSPAPMTQETLL